MSIINDALKKAQKRQAEGQTPLPPPAPGGSPGRNSPMPSQFFVLLALGAVVLIALSVLGTVYLLRRPAAPVVTQVQNAPAPQKKTPTATAAIPETIAPTPPPSPAPAPPPVVVSTPTPAQKSPPPAPSPASSVASVSPAPVAAPPSAPPVVAPPQPVFVAPPPLDPTKPDPKVVAYIDALQIAGVRITGTSSKVLMNDRVYRPNDTVDRMLGLRLKKIEDDTLIFIDERGVIYTKNF